MTYPQIAEILMLVLFGLSWPFNISKSFKSRTAKGKSVAFELIILAAYLVGVSGKLYLYHTTGEFQIVTIVYFIDFVMVTIDVLLYVRNFFIDKQNDRLAREKEAAYEKQIAELTKVQSGSETITGQTADKDGSI